mmetsp:Transcript_441/g.490  ORF Transcript_441/g.490 Transcript_441/m.490 type:complete len:93 (+) Transcript_441:538-816(+)
MDLEVLRSSTAFSVKKIKKVKVPSESWQETKKVLEKARPLEKKLSSKVSSPSNKLPAQENKEQIKIIREFTHNISSEQLNHTAPEEQKLTLD